MNRRKLGSSRKSKGRQHVKEPETEQEFEPRKDVQEETWGIATLQTQVSATTQLEMQEELGQGSEYTSANWVTPLVSAPTHTSESESTAMSFSEGHVEIIVRKDGNEQDCKDETTLEETDKSIAENKETKDCLLVITNESACQINIKEERSNIYFEAESDSYKKADTGLFSQDESFQGKFSVSESHVKIVSESTTPEKAVNNATNKVNREIKSVEQEVIVLPKEELATNEGKSNVFQQPNVRDVRYPEDAVTKVHSVDQTDDYPGSLKLQSLEDSDLCFENTAQSDINAPSDPQLQDKSPSTDGQTDANFSFSGGRQKLGSSRKKKDRRVKESEEKVTESTKGDEGLDTLKNSLQIQTGNQKTLTQDNEQDNFLSISHDSFMCSMYLPGDEYLVQGSVPTKYTETDPQSFISKCESLEETEVNIEMVKNSEDFTQQEVNESNTLLGENNKDVISEGTSREMQETEINSVQMQENLQIDHPMFTGDAVKSCKMVCKTLTDYAEMSELTVKNVDQATVKHDVCSTKEDISEDSDMENEKNLTEDNATNLKYEMKPTDDQTFYQEKEVEGDKLKLSTLQSETVFVDTQPQYDFETVDEQINTGSDKKGKRKRLGSKRRKRLRSLNESKQDIFVNIKDNEVPETTPISLETTTVSQKELKQDKDHDTNQTMSHDSSVNLIPSLGHSAKVHISGAKENPELDLESFILKREKAPEHLNEIDTDNNVEMSDKLGEAVPVDKSDSFQSKEVITPHESVNAVGRHQVSAVQTTQVQESLHIDYAVTDDASGNLETVTGILIDQTEPVLTYQTGSTKKSTDDSVTNQNVAISDDKAIMFFTVKENAKALVQRNEDNLVYESEQIQINKTEREDTTLVQTYEDEGLMEVDIAYSSECSVHQEGSLSEFDQSQLSDFNAPSDNQLQDKSLSTDEQTEANFSFHQGRRKLGSKQGCKVRQRDNKTETEQDSEPGKDVQEEPRDSKTFQTQVSKATQPEMQEESHQRSKNGLPAEPDTSLVLATAHDYSEVKESTVMSCSNEVIEITVRKDNSMQYYKDETKLEETDKNSIAQNEETKESTHDYLSELTNLSACPSIDQQIIKQEGIFIMDVVAGSESNKKANSDLFVGSYSVNTSHVKTCSESTTSEINTDNSANKDRQIRHGIEQTAILLPKEELATNEEKGELFKLPNVRDVQYPEGSVNEVDNKDHKPTKVYSMAQADDSPDSLKPQAADDSDLYSDSLTPEINTYQPENMVKSVDDSATKHADSTSDGKLKLWSAREEITVAFDEVNKDDYIHETKQAWINKSDEVNIALSQTYEVGCPVEKAFAGQSFQDEGAISEAGRNDICVHSPLSDLNDPSSPQLQDESLSIDEKTGANFSFRGNTRKLGSRRGRKGRQRVRDTEIEQGQEPRKDVQEESSDIKTLQTQASKATQLEMQEDDKSEYGTSAEFDTSVVLDTTHELSEVKELTAESYPEDEISKDDHVKHCKDNINLEETDKSNIAQNVETKQNTHDCLSELHSFSACPSSDHEEILNMYVSDELESNKNADADLFSQDESFQGNYSVSESHVKTDSELTTPEITADNSTNIVIREIRGSIEQAVYLLPNTVLAVTEEKDQLFKLFEVSDSQYPKDVVDKVDNGGKLNLWSAGEEKLVEEHFIEQSGNLGVLSEAESNNISVQSPLSDVKIPSEPQLQEKSLSTDEQTDVNFSFRGSRRRLGSSRKNKGKPLGNDFKEEGIKNAKDFEDLEGPKTHPKPDTQSSVLQSKSLQKDQDEGEKDLNIEMVKKTVDDTKEDEDKSDTSYKEDIENVLSDDAQLKREEVEVHPTQMPESLQLVFALQTITGDGTESCEVDSEPLTDLTEISEFTMKSTDDENEECENISEALDLKHNNSDSCHMDKQVEKVESLVSQVYEFKNSVEDDIEPKAEKIFHQDKRAFNKKEGTDSEPTTLQPETVSFDSELHKDSETVDEQTNTGFKYSGNKTKLRSSHRNKGRKQVKKEKENIFWNNRADEAPKKTQMSLETTASQEELKQDIERDINLPVSHDSSMFAPGHSSENHNNMSKTYSEPDLESFVPESEIPPEYLNEKEIDNNVKMSDKSGEATPVIATGQEQVLVDQTKQIFEGLQIDYSSDTMTDEAPFNAEILIARLNEQMEIFDAKFKEKSTDNSCNIQEVSSSDDKQIMLSTGQNMLESVIHRNEDDHVQLEQTLITNTEREVTALSQTDEGEAPLEKDVKDSAEHNIHPEEVAPEAEKNSIYNQSPLTELKAPSDPQLQDKSLSTDEQTDANLSFSGSRRKLGSSRRNKGRHRKESKEDVSENTKDVEVLETLKVSLEIKPATMDEMSQDIKHSNLSVSHDSSMSLMPLPGHSPDVQSSGPTTHPETNPQSLIPKSNTLQKDQQGTETKINMGTDETSVDDTKESVDQSEICHSEDIRNVLSADVQLERQEVELHSTKMQESLQMKSSSEIGTLVDNESCEVVSGPLNDQEEISELIIKSPVYLETTQKSQEEITVNEEELKQNKESDIDLLVSHDSIMFAVLTPGHSSVVHSNVPQSHPEPDLESFVPKRKSPSETTDESETYNNLEMSDKSGKATAVNQDVIIPHDSVIATGQEQVLEDQTTQILESLQIDYSSDTMTDEAPINPEILIGRLNEQTEIVKTELFEESTDDTGNIQEVSSSDDKQITLSTVKDSLEVVIQRNEYDHVHQPEQTLITNTEREVAAFCQTDEGEAPLEKDVKDSAEHNIHPEGVSPEAEKNSIYNQSPLTELKAPSDPQLQDKSLSTDEQTDANLSFSGSRRKLGSSRRNKGRHRGKESKEDVSENTKDVEVLETLKVSLEIKPATMDEMSQDIKHNNLSVSHVSGSLTDVSEISELTTKTDDNSATNQQESPTEENISEASGLKPDNSYICGMIKQQISDLKEVESSGSLVKESNDRVEDDIKLKAQHVQDQEKDGLFLQTVEKKSVALLSETVSFDSQPQNESITVGDQTNSDFSRSGNKRKLRTTGTQQITEFKKEVLENTKDDTALETTEQKELTEDNKHDNLLSVSQRSSMSLMPLPDHASEVQSSKATKYPETQTQTLILGSQNLEESKTEIELDINVEMVEESVRPMQQEIDTIGAFHSDDLVDNAQKEVQKVESHPTQMQESLQIDCSSEGFKGDTTENYENISGNVNDPANIFEQAEYFTKENEVSDLYNVNKPQMSDLEVVDSALRQAHEFKNRLEDDINPESEQIFHQEKAEFSSTVEENEHVLSTLQSESVSFDSQPQNDSLSLHEQTNMEFHNSGSRRKLGSSRRSKGRQTVKDSVTETYNKPIEEDEKKVGGNSLSETTLIGETTGQKEENLHTGAFGWTSELSSVGVHSTSQADEKVIDKPLIPDGDLSSESTELSMQDRCSEENFFVSEPEVCSVRSEINTDKSFSREETDPEDQIKKTSPKSDTNKSPQHTEDGVEKAHEQVTDQEQTEGVLYVCDTTENETDDLVEEPEILSRNIFYSTKSKEKDEDTEMLRYFSDSDVSATPERTTERSSYKERTEVKYSVEQEAFSSPHDNLPTNEEQDESNKIYETTETLLSEDIVIKEYEKAVEPEQMQDMHHIDFISLPQSMSSVQTLQPDANVALDSNSKDNYQNNKDETHSGLKAAGSRRKMGSSRRIKGRQNAKFTEANEEHKEEDVENTENDAATQMFATKAVMQRKSKDLKSVEKFETVSTPDTIISSDKEDSNNKSSKDTKEKHVKIAHDPDDLSQLPGCDTDKKSPLMQSPEASVSKGASDIESILHHDDIITSEPGSVSEPDQDEAIQHQSREAGTLEQDDHLQQTNKVTETVECVASEDCSTEVASSINVQGPDLDEVGEKPVYADQEIESISASEEPPMDISLKCETSTTMDVGNSKKGKTSSDFSETFEAKAQQKKKKFGSSRRTPVSRKQEGDTHNKDETKTESNTEDGMRSLEKMTVVEELPSTVEGVESENVQPLHGILVPREADEAKTSDSDKHRHVQKTEELKPGNTSEEIHSQTVEVKSASPDFSSTNRRRKMGSTRRSLGSRSKRENMDQEEELEIEMTGGDLTSDKVSELKEEKLQVQTECQKTDSDQRKEKVFETATISEFGEALLKPVAEESPVSLSQDDSVSEEVSGGRRKKFGSNRKSHLQQRNRDQNESEVGLINAQNENDARGTTEEGPHEAAEQQTDKSSDVEKITEVDENGDKVSADVGISETKVAVSEMTHRKLYSDENRLGQEREGQLSFAGTNSSNSYNVVLVGESSVGKSSFMKRALSGKFALDIPASVGLDSCKWTVVVDGKPVLLHLWDTAGQERFHSITRHIFHKAQAFLLMYDITSSQSFSAVSYWANSIQESAAENVTVLLLGNKRDHMERQVKTEQGDVLAKEYNFGFMECSAATGENVIEALETVARMLNQNSDLREEAIVLQQRSAPKSQSKCC